MDEYRCTGMISLYEPQVQLCFQSMRSWLDRQRFQGMAYARYVVGVRDGRSVVIGAFVWLAQ